jgi:hypothetical protein
MAVPLNMAVPVKTTYHNSLGTLLNTCSPPTSFLHFVVCERVKLIEEFCRLRCNTMLSIWNQQTFQKNIQPSFSWWSVIYSREHPKILWNNPLLLPTHTTVKVVWSQRYYAIFWILLPICVITTAVNSCVQVHIAIEFWDVNWTFIPVSI